ncbi:MAG: uridine diphosphate-N-acetylglucosamine-binding protein YvcK [Pseudomonadota bacterium]|uniref:uridine diphosphate-N-acetylglucosamine-binding protein YvcK n=1 Tax=Gallaecimonas pentaromativorans TaxID=584787 RepID=UPI00067F2294|nr:uridine diphosphate-N-acetylglucosamine-binding protein YvcK [Gallaecimonas pentaromativorans]MED5526106.1 uridine diphosphate-N-acetylglucosamine-binding protein YvcK [Pseudomonadota bacterium]
MAESPYRPHLAALERVVALGGGHGLGRMLSALNFLGPRLTGIVTTTDNGGSTGRLRRSHHCIAWGDVRNCINQLVTQPSTGSRLFEYRFGAEGELGGHNLGNLILLALDDLCVRPLETINLVRQVLRVKCELLPMTESPADLLALCDEGLEHLGEQRVDSLERMPRQLTLSPKVAATKEAVDAVREADLLILGPGSFLTSVMPPLLLPELAGAFRASKAVKVWVENLGVEQSPVRTLTPGQRLAWLHRQLGFSAVDWVLARPGLDWQQLPAGVRRLEMPLASEQIFYRHDRDALANGLERILAAC